MGNLLLYIYQLVTAVSNLIFSALIIYIDNIVLNLNGAPGP